MLGGGIAAPSIRPCNCILAICVTVQEHAWMILLDIDWLFSVLFPSEDIPTVKEVAAVFVGDEGAPPCNYVAGVRVREHTGSAWGTAALGNVSAATERFVVCIYTRHTARG